MVEVPVTITVDFLPWEAKALLGFLESTFQGDEENNKNVKAAINRLIAKVDNYQQFIENGRNNDKH